MQTLSSIIHALLYSSTPECMYRGLSRRPSLVCRSRGS